jgi:hypothetical protein
LPFLDTLDAPSWWIGGNGVVVIVVATTRKVDDEVCCRGGVGIYFNRPKATHARTGTFSAAVATRWRMTSEMFHSNIQKPNIHSSNIYKRNFQEKQKLKYINTINR